ncbi:peptidase [Lysobacter niastensis]|uniref:Peptidase n=1 Tax=Lysobacter niastensis TaxID=380629 RepID=A0ABS0B4A9_9GAMM|nr:peptidase [Lysobacter niastensis]
MKRSHLFGLLGFASLVACSSGEPQPQPAPGSDRDPHGCIPSAGYSWCAKTQQCERPWELAKQRAFDNTQKAFEDFCRVPETAPGGT